MSTGAVSARNRVNHHATQGRHAQKQIAPKHDPNTTQGKESSTPTIILASVFIAAILLIIILFKNFPEVSESDRSLLKFPRSLSDVRSLSQVLRKYRDENFQIVLAGFCAVYIFLQTFAIPGAIFLSILAGPLFGTWFGLGVVSLVATSGSSLCFLLSKVLGRGLVERCFPSLLTRFRSQIVRHRSNLFFYLLFLRISPLLPNWFISVSSPILDIPWLTFAGATLLGLIPANYLHVTTGLKLEELGSGSVDDKDGSPVNLNALAFLFGIAFIALIPTLLKSKFEQMDATTSEQNANANANANARASPNMMELEEATLTERKEITPEPKSKKKKQG